MEFLKIKDYLELKYREYNQPDFIINDPVCIPHKFTKQEDIEIAAFFAAIFAWGQRVTIINKCTLLMQLMDNAPYQFIKQHKPADLKKLLYFKHRTFNDTDLLYFVAFLNHHYSSNTTLESAFTPYDIIQPDMGQRLIHFKKYFFSLPFAPDRTKKHISSPANNSTCKKLNMFLRWMVRTDTHGVDFGIWKSISPSQLICPCDVHSTRVALRLGLIEDTKINWKTALKLTAALQQFDYNDPVKYDFALFGLGVENAL